MTERWYFILLTILMSIPPQRVLAHPVSYQDGTMVSGTYMRDWIEHDINYTFSPTTSAGLTEFRIGNGKESRDYALPRLNHRFRWNGLDSQTNLYLTAGVGARIDPDAYAPAGLVGLQADYETRRIYTLALAESVLEADRDPLTHLQYRIGFSPWLSGFDDVSTWLIAQVDYRPYRPDDELMVTPLVRLFWHNVLVEAGVSLDGSVMAAWMIGF